MTFNQLVVWIRLKSLAAKVMLPAVSPAWSLLCSETQQNSWNCPESEFCTQSSASGHCSSLEMWGTDVGSWDLIGTGLQCDHTLCKPMWPQLRLQREGGPARHVSLCERRRKDRRKQRQELETPRLSEQKDYRYRITVILGKNLDGTA